MFQNSTGGSSTTSFMLQDCTFPVAWFLMYRKWPLHSIWTILYSNLYLPGCLFSKYTLSPILKNDGCLSVVFCAVLKWFSSNVWTQYWVLIYGEVNGKCLAIKCSSSDKYSTFLYQKYVYMFKVYMITCHTFQITMILLWLYVNLYNCVYILRSIWSCAINMLYIHYNLYYYCLPIFLVCGYCTF